MRRNHTNAVCDTSMHNEECVAFVVPTPRASLSNMSKIAPGPVATVTHGKDGYERIRQGTSFLGRWPFGRHPASVPSTKAQHTTSSGSRCAPPCTPALSGHEPHPMTTHGSRCGVATLHRPGEPQPPPSTPQLPPTRHLAPSPSMFSTFTGRRRGGFST